MRTAVPRQRGRRLAAGVRDLDSRHGAVFFDETIDARERLDVLRRPRCRAQPGVIRPSGETAVASAITSPAPPTAREPRWTKCQSFATAVLG